MNGVEIEKSRILNQVAEFVTTVTLTLDPSVWVPSRMMWKKAYWMLFLSLSLWKFLFRSPFNFSQYCSLYNFMSDW